MSLSRQENTGEFVVLQNAAGAPVVAFQRVDDFRAARWKDPARPQQMHLDVMVTDLDTAEAQVLALGATLLDGSDKPIGYGVYEDPVGHPFCLITPERGLTGHLRSGVEYVVPWFIAAVRSIGRASAGPVADHARPW
ncbi:VOC family protein [Streptomyces sp. NPDC057137]|uniref:VOC family protein n=1 Tax=Streptomyces sp. NPDC057137 TaxID=3346030 RepID=UPI00363A358D